MLTKVTFFPNGTVAAWDKNNNWSPEISNKGWVQLYLEFLESKGIDPTTVHFEAVTNQGSWRRLKPFKIDKGMWNYFIEDNPED